MFEVSSVAFGIDEEDRDDARGLNKIVTIIEHGCTYEPDARHTSSIITNRSLQVRTRTSHPISKTATVDAKAVFVRQRQRFSDSTC